MSSNNGVLTFTTMYKKKRETQKQLKKTIMTKVKLK